MSQPRRLSNSMGHLVIGPLLLAVAGLIDLYIVTKLFQHSELLVGPLTYFIFGAATGVPVYWVLSRSLVGRRLERAGGRYPQRTALIAGLMGAIGTASWFYALTAMDPAIAFSMGNLAMMVLALAEGVTLRIKWSNLAPPVLLFALGIWIFQTPELNALSNLTLLAVAALVCRNGTAIGADLIEKAAAQQGSIVQFTEARFFWLAGSGIPLALGTLFAKSQLEASIDLLGKAWTAALPLQILSMALTFIGSFYRVRAKRDHLLTVCSAAYSTPLVVTPTLAILLNSKQNELFPTVEGSFELLAGAILVLTAVIWLSNIRYAYRKNTSQLKPVRSAG